MTEGLPAYWYSRFVFERALALIYLIAFVCAANQFVPLLGERGLLPISRFIQVVPFRVAPSLFYALSSDGAIRTAAWLGVGLSGLVLTGYPQQWGTAISAALWAALWILYLSFVNVGQTFYAFGWESLLLETRARHEIVIEGTSEVVITDGTGWRAYEFKGKPGDTSRLPMQIAPYHLRLDWLMWFAAMSPPSRHPWFTRLLEKLLEGDRSTLALLRTNPFPDGPPRWVRASYYEYRFTSADERQQTGRWWSRREIGPYMAPVTLQDATRARNRADARRPPA
jgi:hypothetical protein